MESFEIKMKPIIIRDGPSKKVIDSILDELLLLHKYDLTGKLENSSSKTCLWNLFLVPEAALHNFPIRKWRKGDGDFTNFHSILNDNVYLIIKAEGTSWKGGPDTERKDFCSENSNLDNNKRSSDVKDWGPRRQKNGKGRLTRWQIQKYFSSDIRFTKKALITK